MRADLQGGGFGSGWMSGGKAGQPTFKATRRNWADHPIEEVGAKLRAMMPWLKDKKLVDKTRN